MIRRIKSFAIDHPITLEESDSLFSFIDGTEEEYQDSIENVVSGLLQGGFQFENIYRNLPLIYSILLVYEEKIRINNPDIILPINRKIRE